MVCGNNSSFNHKLRNGFSNFLLNRRGNFTRKNSSNNLFLSIKIIFFLAFIIFSCLQFIEALSILILCYMSSNFFQWFFLNVRTITRGNIIPLKHRAQTEFWDSYDKRICCNTIWLLACTISFPISDPGISLSSHCTPMFLLESKQLFSAHLPFRKNDSHLGTAGAFFLHGVDDFFLSITEGTLGYNSTRILAMMLHCVFSSCCSFLIFFSSLIAYLKRSCTLLAYLPSIAAAIL